LQIAALREVALVLSYVRKTQLVLTNKIPTDLFRLSALPQFSLNLNRCAVHASGNIGV